MSYLTTPCPQVQTLRYLEVLGEEMEDMHTMLFPVLAMQLLLAECVLENRPLTSLLHMR